MPHHIHANPSNDVLPAPLVSSASTATSLLTPKVLVTPNRHLRTFSRAELALLITQGHILVLHHAFIYRLNEFLLQHPGGDLPVLHFVGRDATDEIEAYHPAFALKQMRHYVVGKVSEEEWAEETTGWKPLTPPTHLGWEGTIQAYAGVESWKVALEKLDTNKNSCVTIKEDSPGTTSLPFLSTTMLEPVLPEGLCPVEQQRLARSFRALRLEMLQIDGLFEVAPWDLYKNTIFRCAALFASFLASYVYATQKWHLAVSALSLGFFWHQIMFCAHDAGHTEITGNRTVDRYIGGVIASFASGMSLGWWIDQHDVHHLIPNDPVHDPDIQLLPFFAFSNRFFDSLYSTFHRQVMHFDAPARFLLQIQHLTFYPVMVFARFSLFGKSYYYLITKAKADNFRTFEFIGVAFFWTWYTLLLKGLGTGLDGWVTRVWYTLLVLLAVCPIHVQIVLSHSAQNCEDVGPYESFVHRQLRTTMDVSCPEWLDFVHGGLQMQTVHHLFPRLPRPNLRFATDLVKQWAAENNVAFLEKDFGSGNGQLLGMLKDIAGQCRALHATVGELSEGKIEME